MENNDRFKQIIDNIEESHKNGIGTLQEKTMHRVLKYYFDDDVTHHEIKVGPYYADILNNKHIYEIQTRSLNKLRNKLEVFLREYSVTVVYPIDHTKWLHWFDQETLTAAKKRKSPKVGTFLDCFHELYKIKPFLNHPRISVCLMLIDVDEYRNLDGWDKNKKRGSSRLERFPIKLHDIKFITDPINYQSMLPPLPLVFTVADFKKATSLSLYQAGVALTVLSYVNAITVVGKDGRKNQYSLTKLT